MTEYLDYLCEAFGRFGAVRVRPMFGGHGLFHQGLMFALVFEDELFLKADRESVEAFEALGLEAFRYTRKGKFMSLSYYRAPDEILDDPDAAARWGGQAYQAALRSRKKQPARNLGHG